MMTEYELNVLGNLGINVSEFTTVQRPGHASEVVDARITINQDVFGPMCRHLNLVSIIANSKNPQVTEMYGQLLSLALLSEKEK